MSLTLYIIAYVVGTVIGYFLSRHNHIYEGAENAVRYLKEAGFVAWKKTEDDEIELIKLEEYLHGINVEENERRGHL